MRLGDVCKLSKVRNRDGLCTDVYSVTNSQGFIPSVDYFNKEVFSNELRSYRVVERGMLAYNPSRINVGSIALQNKADCVVVSPLYVVFSVDERRVLPEYLLSFLKCGAGLSQISANSIGTVRNNLKFEGLCNITIVLPSLEAQRRRVLLMREIDRLVRGARSQLSLLDGLVKSRFVEMFEKSASLKMVRLKDVCSVITDGTHQSPKFQSEGVPFLFVSNIANNELTYETSKYISLEDYETLIKRTPIEIGDILVSAVGSFGHPAIVKDERPFCFQRHIAYLKPRQEKVNSVFLHSALLSDGAQRYMDSAAKGVAQRTVTLNSFKELVIPLPPLSLQQEFAAFAAEVDKSRVVVQRQVVKYNDVIASSGIAIIGRGELV